MSSGAVRKVRVPAELKSKGKDNDIRAWARKQLNGQEADLSTPLINKIKRGEMAEVVLRPKKAGFFLPDGSFIEASDTSVEFGEDLDQAEVAMADEENDWSWAEEENARFNKGSIPEDSGSGTTTRELWAHGQRIAAHAAKTGRKMSRLRELLVKRSGPTGYGKMTHETACEFYEWKPALSTTDPMLGWSWHVIDAVLRFSSNGTIRERMVETINGHLLPVGGKQQTISDFLRGPDAKKPIWKQDTVFLEDVRLRLKQGASISEDETTRLVLQFKQAAAVQPVRGRARLPPAPNPPAREADGG